GNAHSPYSSSSSMAGNTLMISLEQLADEGLLDQNLFVEDKLKAGKQVDYEGSAHVKHMLLDHAWQVFNKRYKRKGTDLFKSFCKNVVYLLDNFALFTAIKHQQAFKPWYEWLVELKQRHSDALTEFKQKNRALIEKIKWLQYVFFSQWDELKRYANKGK